MAALNQETAQAFIIEQVHELYQALSEGKDVSISHRFALEGQINLLLDYHLIAFHWLKEVIDEAYSQWIDGNLNPDMWQWMKDDDRFYLPIKMYDAPVYKSGQ